MRQPLAEALACQDAGANLGDDRAQAADVGVARQQLERVVEPRARLEQQREIEGEHRHVLGLCALAQREEGRGGGRAFFRDGVDRHQAEIFDSARDLGGGRRRDLAGDDLAGLGQRLVAEVWHLKFPLSMILSENRFALFGIMLTVSSSRAAPRRPM
jgi:hypothetical protein